MRYSGKIAITIILMLLFLCNHLVNADPDQVGEPAPENDTVWNVDVGTGTVEKKGKTITIYKDGAPVSGILQLKDYDNIILVGRDDVKEVHAYLLGENDFKVELEISGDGGISVGRHFPEDASVPVNVSLSVEFKVDGSGGSDYPGQIDPDSDDFQNRIFYIDFGDGNFEVDGYDEPVTAWLKGKQAEGERVVESAYAIKLEDFDKETMKVSVIADDGFTVELVPNEDNEVSLWRYEPSHFVLPNSTMHFAIEKKKADNPDPPVPVAPNETDPPKEDKRSETVKVETPAETPAETEPASTEAPQQENTEESSGLPLAAIIAIIAGALLLIFIIALVIMKKKFPIVEEK